MNLLTDQEAEIAKRYRQRSNRFAWQASILSQWRSGLAVGRVSVFGMVAAILLWGFLTSASLNLWFTFALVAAIAWVACTLVIEAIQARLRYARCLQDINDEEVARMQRDWNQIPLTMPDIPDESKGLADDLDNIANLRTSPMVDRSECRAKQYEWEKLATSILAIGSDG